LKYDLLVQLTISTLLALAFFRDAFSVLWRLPILVILIAMVNLYTNAFFIAWKTKAKKMKLSWFITPPDFYNQLINKIHHRIKTD